MRRKHTGNLASSRLGPSGGNVRKTGGQEEGKRGKGAELGEKDGGGGENQARNTTRRDQTRVSHTVSKLCLFFFFWERRESTPTLFRDWENFSNYPVLKWRAIGSIFFPFFSTYGCSSTREFEGVDRGVEG